MTVTLPLPRWNRMGDHYRLDGFGHLLRAWRIHTRMWRWRIDEGDRFRAGGDEPTLRQARQVAEAVLNARLS